MSNRMSRMMRMVPSIARLPCCYSGSVTSVARESFSSICGDLDWNAGAQRVRDVGEAPGALDQFGRIGPVGEDAFDHHRRADRPRRLAVEIEGHADPNVRDFQSHVLGDVAEVVAEAAADREGEQLAAVEAEAAPARSTHGPVGNDMMCARPADRRAGAGEGTILDGRR